MPLFRNRLFYFFLASVILGIAVHAFSEFRSSESTSSVKQKLFDEVASARFTLSEALREGTYTHENLFLIGHGRLLQWGNAVYPVDPNLVHREPGLIEQNSRIYLFHKRILSADSTLLFLKEIQNDPEQVKSNNLIKGQLRLNPESGFEPISLGPQTVYYQAAQFQLSDWWLFNPSLYASSQLFPSLGHLLINTLILSSFLLWILKLINHYRIQTWINPLVISISGVWLAETIKSTVYNSQFTIDIIESPHLTGPLVVVWLTIICIARVFLATATTLCGNDKSGRWIVLLVVVAHNILAYYRGQFDLIEINWFVPVFLVPYLPLSRNKTRSIVIAATTFTLGWGYIFVKHEAYHKSALLERAEKNYTKNEDPLAEYLIDLEIQKLERAMSPAQLDTMSQPELDRLLLTGYLRAYQLIEEHEVSNPSGEYRFNLGKRVFRLLQKPLYSSFSLPYIQTHAEFSSYTTSHNVNVALYSKGKLVYSKGGLRFPDQLTRTPEELFKNHLIKQQRSSNGVLLLAIEKNGPAEQAALWIAFFVAVFFLGGGLERLVVEWWTSLTGKIFLAFLALTFILVVSLSSFTVYTVISQFAERNQSAISEKMKSLSNQLAAKGNTALVPDDRALRALAEIYYSDLHLFDQSGYLVSSSEREWFNRNLLAPRMNPSALRKMQAQPEPLILNEKLGDIAYQSGYCQLEIGGAIHYINLPYYARQLDLEQDLRQYAASSLTALLLFLIAAVLGAAFLANRITLPLVWLSREISRSSIEPLDYLANDEIGMLALAYNEKLEQLRHYGEELAKKERESAWRDLARQVAHEVKNPLTPIKLNAQFLQRQLANNDPESIEKTKNFLQGLIRQVDVLAQMANEFSHFANLPAPQVEMFSVLNCLEQCVDALQWPEINVIIENQGDPYVSADRNQMTRVFNNLLKNAAQAIALRQLRDDQTGVIRVSLSVERDHVVLRFKDNGIGMDEPTLQKLFTPNFTTKSDGSGLGLSMSKQIIEQAGGTISARSEPNQGAEFEVKLPVKQ